MTLVEVLVALAILGFVAAAIVGLIGQSSRFVANQEERMLAGVLVDNAMVEALARQAPLERGEAESPRAFAGRNWVVKTAVTDSGVPGVVRIVAEVRADTSGQTLASAMTLKVERK